MPIVWALTDPRYRFADFVQAHIHPYFGIGLYWIAFIAVLIGIAMQWYAAAKYAKVYIDKYDEIHKAEAAQKQNVEQNQKDVQANEE